MTNIPQKTGQDHQQFSSRRGFFQWVGQVAAGASLAGIGLGLTNPLNAFAANKSDAGKHHPNCISCDSCKITNCVRSSGCLEGTGMPFRVSYIQYYGCVTHGTCPSYNAVVCADSCCCDC